MQKEKKKVLDKAIGRNRKKIGKKVSKIITILLQLFESKVHVYSDYSSMAAGAVVLTLAVA